MPAPAAAERARWPAPPLLADHPVAAPQRSRQLAIGREYAAVLAGARQRVRRTGGLGRAVPRGQRRARGPAVHGHRDLRPGRHDDLPGGPDELAATAQLVFEQYLARDYSEEPAILHAFAGSYEQSGVLVTFNGKSFDMTHDPRAVGLPRRGAPWAEPPHLDLLHEARRRWKGQLPNCKLQTLEQHLCGRQRVGDIPGARHPRRLPRVRPARGDARAHARHPAPQPAGPADHGPALTVLLTGCDPSPDWRPHEQME